MSITHSAFLLSGSQHQVLFQAKDWKACRPCGAFEASVCRIKSGFSCARNFSPMSRNVVFPRRNLCPPTDMARSSISTTDSSNASMPKSPYAFVRQRKPQRVVEVGSGNTTLVNAAAMRKNAAEGFPGELFAIEPYPAPYLKQGLPGLTRLIPAKVQDAPFDLFLSLKAGDILFIDSSHVVSMDSDVLYELLGILPKLAPGVLIHFHDIFSPLDYPEKFVKRNLCFWGEQYMLEAFLSFNSAFKVVWTGSAMQHFHPEVLREAFPKWEGSFSRMPSDLKMFALTPSTEIMSGPAASGLLESISP